MHAGPGLSPSHRGARRPWPRSWRRSILLAGSLVVPGLAACGGEESAPGQQAPPATTVEVEVASVDTVTVDVRAVGSLEAEALVTVRAESPGRVIRIPVAEGTRVGSGTLLLLMDTTKLAAEVRAAEGSVARARADRENLARQVERNRALLDQGAISPQTFDDLRARAEVADAALQEAEARLELARRRLDDASVRAPFAGEVGQRFVDPGAYLEPGDPLFELVDDDPLEIDVQIPERHLGRLELGRRVELQVRSRPDEVFAGTVSFVSPVVDPVNRTVQVKARVANPGRELRAGQFADVRLALESRPDAIVVPEAAIVPGRERDVVYRVREGRAEQVTVTLGARAPGRVEIRSGIQAGDTVVVAGQQRLRDGAPIRLAGG